MIETESPILLQSPAGFGPEAAATTFSPADSTFTFPHEPPTSVPSASRRRKSSTKGAVSSAAIKRSMSSPNVRGLSNAAELPGSLAEKRRNKLGYHRTSVACVHCRRRKIRCLLAADDHQNRCSNCIRLKKECNFFPVDQQPPLDRRPRAGSKTEGPSGDHSGSSSASPTLPPGQGMDQMGAYEPPPFMPLNHPYPGTLGPPALSPPGSAALLPGPFEHPDHPGAVGWDSHIYDSPGGNSTPDGGPPNNFWMKPETPLTPSYSPFTSAHAGPPFPAVPGEAGFPSPIGNGHAPPRTEADWPQPSRSMSYSHLEGLHHGHQPSQHGPEAFNQIYQPELRRNTSDMLPPSLRTSSIGSSSAAASVPDASMPPMSAPPPLTPGAPQSPYQFGNVWAALPNQKSMEFGNWYNEPGQLAKVQEEEVPPHYVEEGLGMYPPDGRV